MRLEYVRHVGGPNIFTRAPVAVARIELGELTCRENTDFPGFTERLLLAFPGLREHHCAAGRPGGFTGALARGTYFGHVTEHIALELSGLAGRDVRLGRTMWAGADGRYDVMTECPRDEPEGSPVPAELYQLAIDVVTTLLAKQRPEVTASIEAIARVVERERLGPSTAAIAQAARDRGIPVRRVGPLSMLRLGYGCHRRLVSAAMTEQTSAIGVDIAGDKVLAKELLARAGIAVPDGVVARSEAEAAAALQALGAPVVIKPRNGNHGRCVSVGIRTAEQAGQAYRRSAAGAGSAEVIVESYVPGHDYRVLMIDGQLRAAARLSPPEVTGDGTSTIAELISALNADPRRGHGHSRPLTTIGIDDAVAAHLAASGLEPGSVPAAGRQVGLRRNGNLSTGGTSRDVTALVHPDIAELCRRAAAVTGLDICGIDLRAADISAPLLGPAAQPAAVLEINACPGLRMHLAPAEGAAQPVAEAIVDRLYPPGAPARVPVIAVTGTNGKTSTVRMIAHILGQTGLRTGMSCTDGVHIGSRCVLQADASGPRSAEAVLDDSTVEAAVLETARGGIIRRGLGYDQADVAVITNISADHLGDDNVDDLGELIEVKALVAEEIKDGGCVVLNADDKATAAIASRQAVRRHAPAIRYFSVSPGSAVISRHKRAGGICYEVCDGQLTETAGGRQRVIMNVADLPGSFTGRARHVVANALAAAAACRAIGITIKDISDALGTFVPGEVNPGRGNVYAVAAGPDAAAAAGPVVVDYGHNAAALEATGEMIARVWGGRPVAAITLPGDRRDDLVAESAAAIAAWFGTVVIYEDDDLRERDQGEMRELITAAVKQARPGIVIRHADGPLDALSNAIALAAGAPVLFLYEKLAAAHAALDAAGATPWPEEDLMGELIADGAAEAGQAAIAGQPDAGPADPDPADADPSDAASVT